MNLAGDKLLDLLERDLLYEFEESQVYVLLEKSEKQLRFYQ